MSEGGGQSSAQQQIAMNHGKGATGGVSEEYSLNKFGRNAEAANVVMHGHDVHMSSSMQEIIESLKNHTSSSSSGDGGGGGSTNVSYADLGSHSGPILNTGASQQSMVDMVGGKNSDRGRGDSGGGMGV